MNQDTLMRFDPATRAQQPYPSHAAQWRKWHGRTAWLYNPWTGDPRRAEDVGSDTFGHLILPPGERLMVGELGAIRQSVVEAELRRNGDSADEPL